MSQEYKEKAARLQKELATLSATFPDVFKQPQKALDEYLEDINKQRLQVAIVGSVKSGKTTLLNALLGEEIGISDVTPETAVLTYFRKAEDNDKNYLKVRFYTGSEWKKLRIDIDGKPDSVFSQKYREQGAEKEAEKWIGHEPITIEASDINALKAKMREYGSSQSARHYFVKELEIGLQNYQFDVKIYWVDTPGLGDPVEYRKNITKDYIRRADAVVICISSEAMRDEDFETATKVLEDIGNNKEKVIVLGTKIDRLNDSKSEWEKQQKVWFSHLEPLFKDRSVMGKNVIGVSSQIFFQVQDLQDGKESFQDGEGKDITKQVIRKIATFAEQHGIEADNADLIRKRAAEIQRCSGIHEFTSVLRSGPLSAPERMLNEAAVEKYQRIEQEVKDIAARLKKDIEEQESLLNANIEKREAASKQIKEELEKMEKQEQTIKQEFEKIKTESGIQELKKSLRSTLDATIGAA
jgi:GTPase SAR1 family protein